MATVKVKIITARAEEAFAYKPGDIVEIPSEHFYDSVDDRNNLVPGWESSGMAILAPDGEVAAAQIAELGAQLADATAARVGLAASVTDLQSKLAVAQGEKAGAIADKVLAKKAADDARAAQTAAESAAAQAASAAAADLAAAQKERDEFAAQAGELGGQLAAALAEIETLKAAPAAPEGAASISSDAASSAAPFQ